MAGNVDTAGAATSSPDVWGTFDGARERLSRQFRDVAYRPETGAGLEALRAEVEAWLRENADAPRVLQRAHVFRIVTSRGRICVDPEDWFADKLEHGGLMRELQGRWLGEAERGEVREAATWQRDAHRLGLARAGIDLGHISPGWENMFRGGLRGLIEQARREREAHGDALGNSQKAFYEAVEIVYDAAISLAARFSELATRMAYERPEHGVRLRALAEACARVPAEAPRTFHEALQFAWFMHELIEMEGEWVRSMGHFDRTMVPYYRADLESGRLTREQAKELILFFWFKWYARTEGKQNGKNFVFGGQDAAGEVIANDLTYLALEAYEELGTPDPKLSVRFLPETPEALYRRVADLVRKGHNSFVLMNDPVAVEAMVRRGKAVEDARLYLPIGCYEPAVDGREAGCTMNVIVNLAKAVELALNDGVDPVSGRRVGPATGDATAFKDFEELFEAYAAQLDHIVERAIACTAEHERAWPRINPSPLIAGTIEDCLARGKDIGEGGARYNSVGCVGLGLANACDSLAALRRAVFEEERFTMGEVIDALASDFEGRETMRLYLLNRIPKWGNGDRETDGIGRRVADRYCERVHAFTNGRGGPCQAALFSLDHRVEFGAATGALPDGRRAGETLAPGVGATAGLEKAGVTGLIHSATSLDFTETPNGAVLDVMLHPTAVSGEDGLEAFVALIKTFFAEGGYAIQFNVVDPETLREAQRRPEAYANLQIRVTGWSVYFTSLTKSEQDHFISRNYHGL